MVTSLNGANDYWGDDYSAEDVTDPTGPSNGSFCVLRGGGWTNFARHLRSADRFRFRPSCSFFYMGFRFAREVMKSGKN